MWIFKFSASCLLVLLNCTYILYYLVICSYHVYYVYCISVHTYVFIIVIICFGADRDIILGGMGTSIRTYMQMMAYRPNPDKG